jgi:hypothetical protein
VTAPVRLTDADEKMLAAGCSGAFGALVAAVERILADRLPEATTVTERRARRRGTATSYEVEPGSSAWGPRYVMEERTVTRYADHVGPWEQVTE